jgi:hypothetical protein
VLRDDEPTLRASPPPAAPPTIDPQTLAAVLVGGALAVAAAGLLVPGTWAAYYAPRLWLPLWVIGCLVFGGALLAQRNRWVVRFTRLQRHQIVEWGGGAYGAIALTCFGWLEWGQFRELLDALLGVDWRSAEVGARSVVQMLTRNLADFFVGSFMSGLQAFIWPAFWSKAFSAGQFWPAMLVGWGVFECARWAVRHAARAEPPRPGTPR